MNSLLYIGQSALLNSQYATSVHGNNIANQTVEGYRRRTVAMTELPSLSTSKGQVGTGATVSGLLRHFNTYLETQYLRENGQSAGYKAKYDALSQVETRFVEDEKYGTAALLENFWAAWGDVADNPDQSAARSVLLTTSESLTSRLADLAEDLAAQQRSLEKQISQEVDAVNTALAQIAAVNKQLAGSPNRADLLDSRDALLRDLSGRLDIEVAYGGDGQALVKTSAGQTLVDGASSYGLTYKSPYAAASLEPDSAFKGAIWFDGASSDEFTVEITDPGTASGGAGAAMFRVSLDGGRTWLKDDDGNELRFTAGSRDESVTVGGVTIWFGQSGDSGAEEGTALSAGDRFTIVPKTSVAWKSTAGGEVNVTPLAGNTRAGRLTGGTLGGLLAARDECIGSYRESLDAFASTLIWETNRIHSQGSGLTPLSSATGAYGATYTDRPLAQSGLAFADRVTAGSFSLALYDADTGAPLGITAVDFSSVTPGQATFDPSVHSLEDVAAAITASFGGQLTASVQAGRLTLTAADGVTFDYADDSAGIFAATGHNCFFTGTDASSIAVNQELIGNTDRICAGHVNGDGEANSGDNTTAEALAALAEKSVSFFTTRGSSSATLGGYFSTLVAQVGADKSAASTSYQFAASLAEDLDAQQESVGGVNEDEELTQLMRQQQNYQAASKMIQVSLEMIDVLLALK